MFDFKYSVVVSENKNIIDILQWFIIHDYKLFKDYDYRSSFRGTFVYIFSFNDKNVLVEFALANSE
jgi:hypothetical protein